MHESLPIAYPDAAVARYCEERATAIKGLLGRGVRIAAQIGRLLEEVRAILPHGLWGLWLDRHFTWSPETARKYRLLAQAVDHNPRILEFQSVELAIAFPSLPARTQEAILVQGAVRRRDALEIIERHMIEDWRTEIEELVITDPGRAYHEITLAKDHQVLQEVADEMMQAHAELFALLSDREVAEILAEAGVTRNKRLGGPARGRPNAQLVESSGGCTLVVWAGAAHTVAIFPRLEDPVARSWQAMIIDRVVEVTGAKTLDGIVGELL